MYTYHASLTTVNGTSFTQTFSVGSHTLSITFLWDTANEEQYTILYRALAARASSDPLIKASDSSYINRDYDWIDWMLALPTDIETALNEGMEYPQSMRKVSNTIKANLLQESKEEAAALKVLIDPLITQLAWNVTVTDENGNITTGVVRPGGWLHNQDSSWRIRFVSSLTDIGKDDLLNMQLEFEVDE